MRKIFFACTTHIIQEETDEGSWSWVNVSYVCSSWRRIALECQDLWRYIDFSHPKWHAITFGRAKICPLHIQATITDRNIRLLHRTLYLANRIEDIRLTGTIQHINSLLAILTCPNPSLQSLIVDVRIPQNRDALVCDPPLTSFPTSGLPLRDLTYMELYSAPFHLLTPRCTFLTHLHLHDLPLTERPTFRYFLSMLEKLERLQYLTLDRAFPINISFDVGRASDRRVRLPQLRRINLGGSMSEIVNLLDSIMFPPSVCIICKVCTFFDLKASVYKFGQQLRAHSWARTDRLSSLVTLVVTRNESCSRFTDGFEPNPEYRQSLRFRAFREDCERGEAAFDITFNPEETISDDDLMITALTATWKGLSLSQVHTLALQNLDIVTQKTWLEYLRTLRSLRILDITGRPPSGLVWALLLNAKYQLPDTDAYQGAHRLLVPKLNDIYLCKVDCSSGGFMVSSTAPVNSYLNLDDSRFLDVLVVSLTARRLLGFFLRSLSISRCEYVLHQSVEDARKSVRYFVCDNSTNNINNDKETFDEQWPARYWEGRNFKNCQLRHFYRLRRVVVSEPD